MTWPPIKAWTSTTFINGYKHFVAINYGGKGINRWVLLVSVLDSNIVIKLSWAEISDRKCWLDGWIDLDKNTTLKKGYTSFLASSADHLNSNSELYPSFDSGLRIPNECSKVRQWK